LPDPSLFLTLYPRTPLQSAQLTQPSVGANLDALAIVDNFVLSPEPEESNWRMMLAGGAFMLRRVAPRHC
jgi:hypothetical protein